MALPPQQADLTSAQKLELARNQSQLLLDAASGMRHIEVPGITLGAHHVHAALVQARAQLDRLEEIWLSVLAFRDNAQLEARQLERDADDAWDDLADKARSSGSRYEYEGAQERYATWRVKVRAQREAARVTRDVADIFAAAERAVALMYKGLDSTRLDMHRRLSALAFEDSLSR